MKEAKMNTRPENNAATGMAGSRFGRWTVLEDFITTPKGENKWRCRCDCGTERYVLERSLKYGGSKSCGCLTRERVYEAVAYDLLGQTFGNLTVVGRSKKRTKRGGYWTCLCKCGYTCEATATDLVTGKKTHCGCQSVTNYAYVDITGQKFHRLTALYRVKNQVGRGGSVVWHCRCDCGKEVDLSYNDLMYSNVKSCGCQKKEHDQKLSTFLTHVGGTSLDAIQSQKLPSDNTTGYKGVYLVKGKYLAKIVFQKKQYFLGTYEKIEDAAEARKEAEQLLFGETAEFIKRWKGKATDDPEWAEENPVEIQVKRDAEGRLTVSYSPQI